MIFSNCFGWGVTLAVACALGSPLAAQGMTGDGPARDRTGPHAETAPPSFVEPPADFRSPVQTPAAVGLTGHARIGAIIIESQGTLRATVHGDWAPARDAVLELELTPTDLLDAAWVEQQFMANGFVGETVPLDRLVALVQLINRAFAANGYINSGVLINGPPPDDGAPLRLRLVSGRLVDEDGAPAIDVRWADGQSGGLTEDYVRARMATAGTAPLNAIAVERQFRGLTEDPAIGVVDADLRPGTRPGEARLLLTVQPARRFDLYATAANNRSPSIGSERYAAGGSMRNLFFAGDLISVEGGTTGGRGDILASYDVPIIDTLTRLLVRGGYNEAAVIDPQLQPLGIEASDWFVEGGIAHDVVRAPLLPDGASGWRPARTITLGLRLTNRTSRTELLGQPFSFSPGAVGGRAEYTAFRVTADWVERGVDTVLAVSLTGTQGMAGTQSRVPGLLSPDTDFRSFRAQASYARRLDQSGLELRARLGGQWADGILYSGERFGVGGVQSVRGYRETLLLTDSGIAGSIELAMPLRLASRSRDFDWSNFIVSVFADGAIVDNREGPDPVPDNIASIGAAISWRPVPAISASLSYGESLNDAPFPGTRAFQDRGFHWTIIVRPLDF